MKRFVMTLAAMLLVSIGAFAQIGATLKGDVNGDGKVDVEDVTSLVDIILTGKTYGYFYFGTTLPTAENYQTLSGVVASYTSIDDAIGTTASIAEGQTLYLLCPAAWVKVKRVVLENGIGTTYNFIEDADAETISGYVIYRTQAWNETTDLTLNFEINSGDEYYWYVGTSKPTSINGDVINPNTDVWYLESTTPIQLHPESSNIIPPTTWYVLIPHSSGFQVYDTSGSAVDSAGYTKTTESIDGIEYDVFTTSNILLNVNSVFKQ